MEANVVEVSSANAHATTGGEMKTAARKPYSTKRRRIRSLALASSSFEDRSVLVDRCRREVCDLCLFFREHLVPRLEGGGGARRDGAIACLMEGSALPLTELAEEISKAVEGVELQSLLTDLPFIGTRLKYGIADDHAVGRGEDEELRCLWCWEAREVSLFPKSQRGLVKFLRAMRKKVHTRIAALSVTMDAMSNAANSEEYKLVLLKASERLGQESSLDDLRASVEKFLQKSSMNLASKEVKVDEGSGKANVEKEEAMKDKETQKENAWHEKELKRLKDEADKEAKKREKEEMELKKRLKRQQEEAEKEERKREKEEMELKKRLKRQQDEAEREQKRREKEEAESRKQSSLRKQATLMEKFLKLKTDNASIGQCAHSSAKTPAPQSIEENVDATQSLTLLMDSALSDQSMHSIDDLRKFHLAAWHKLCHVNKSKCWGIRNNPRSNVAKEIRLQGPPVIWSTEKASNKEQPCSQKKVANPCIFKDSDDLDEITCDLPGPSGTDIVYRNNQKSKQIMKLLQFDKSPRPAYYGTWSRKSTVVGPRRPLGKDPELDYDFESDEEWEEEEPGESLTDCEKDEDDLEECDDAKGESKDESEDSFVVPDGYLSENEGAEMDVSTSDAKKDDAASFPSSQPEVESEEFRLRLQQMKYLNSLTEKALSKSQPLIISNLMHEKSNLLSMEDLHGLAKIESTCLQALCMQFCSGGSVIQFSSDVSLDADEELCQSRCRTDASPAAVAPLMPESKLPEIVRSIQSCPQSMGKVVEVLQQKFPAVSKKQIKSKVREIAEFVDNHWKVKKEVLDGLGLSPPLDKSKKPKGIATFFSKRCLPPPTGDDVCAADSSPLQKKLRTVAATANAEEPDTTI